MKFEYEEKYQYPTHILLNVTDDCNLQCRYCFVEQHPHYMDLETAKLACDWAVKNYLIKKEKDLLKPNEQLSIYFFGGEPILMFDNIIKPIVEYMSINYNYIPYCLGLTTNGTLLNQDKIDFLKNNNVYILLSCDGNNGTQNYNRPCKNKEIDSFDLIKKNFYPLLDAYPDICFRSTIYAPTVDQLFNNYIFAELLGFQAYYCMPDERHPWTKQQKEELYTQCQQIFWYRCNQYMNNIKPMSCSFIDEMFNTILNIDKEIILKEPSKEHLNPTVLRCGLGTTSIAVGYDGNLYGCQEQPSKDLKNIFLIGNLYKDGGINEKRHFELLNKYYNSNNLHCENLDICNSNCPMRNYCYDKRCPSASFEIFNDFNELSEIRCKWRQMLFNNCQTTMKLLVEKDNQLFKKYLYSLSVYQQIFKNEGENSNVYSI